MAEITSPGEIERQSMKIIAGELEDKGICLPEENRPVVHRVIHATADFEYASSLCFTDHAVRYAVKALCSGTPIVTDTNMAKAGISTVALNHLHADVHCLMADPEIAERAHQAGTTRAFAAMHVAAERYPDALFAVGNAPTALLALAERIENGFRPALVIGVPVGFVNVVESKERILAICESCGVPAIVAAGRKGGSTVAAAICNALLYLAADMTDPSARGWN